MGKSARTGVHGEYHVARALPRRRTRPCATSSRRRTYGVGLGGRSMHWRNSARGYGPAAQLVPWLSVLFAGVMGARNDRRGASARERSSSRRTDSCFRRRTDRPFDLSSGLPRAGSLCAGEPSSRRAPPRWTAKQSDDDMKKSRGESFNDPSGEHSRKTSPDGQRSHIARKSQQRALGSAQKVPCEMMGA